MKITNWGQFCVGHLWELSENYKHYMCIILLWREEKTFYDIEAVLNTAKRFA